MGETENRQEQEKQQQEQIRDNGQLTLQEPGGSRIHLLSVIGEIEGHDNLSANSKTTKY